MNRLTMQSASVLFAFAFFGCDAPDEGLNSNPSTDGTCEVPFNYEPTDLAHALEYQHDLDGLNMSIESAVSILSETCLDEACPADDPCCNPCQASLGFVDPTHGELGIREWSCRATADSTGERCGDWSDCDAPPGATVTVWGQLVVDDGEPAYFETDGECVPEPVCEAPVGYEQVTLRDALDLQHYFDEEDISFDAEVVVLSETCLDEVCDSDDPCCNRCQASLGFSDDEFGQINMRAWTCRAMADSDGNRCGEWERCTAPLGDRVTVWGTLFADQTPPFTDDAYMEAHDFCDDPAPLPCEVEARGLAGDLFQIGRGLSTPIDTSSRPRDARTSRNRAYSVSVTGGDITQSYRAEFEPVDDRCELVSISLEGADRNATHDPESAPHACGLAARLAGVAAYLRTSGQSTFFNDEYIEEERNDVNEVFSMSFEDPFAAWYVVAQRDTCEIVHIW